VSNAAAVVSRSVDELTERRARELLTELLLATTVTLRLTYFLLETPVTTGADGSVPQSNGDLRPWNPQAACQRWFRLTRLCFQTKQHLWILRLATRYTSPEFNVSAMAFQ
jgi:hypothetical protein